MSWRKRISPWDIGIVLGGMGLVFSAGKIYKRFEFSNTTFSPVSLSPTEAKSRAESAKNHVQSYPEDFNAYSQLAIAYFYMGPNYYADALNALDRARDLGATSESLFYYAGIMYDVMGLPEYAVNELEKFHRHSPGDYETSIRLANLYWRTKRTDQVMVLYKQLIDRWPNDPTIWFNYAIIQKEKSQLDDALQSLAKVMKLSSGQLPEGGQYLQGEIARLKGQEDQAMGFYQQEISRNPQYLPALESLEALHRRKGQLKEAQVLRKTIAALKHTPTS